MKHLIGIALAAGWAAGMYGLHIQKNWAGIFLVWMLGWELPEVIKWWKRRRLQ